jgi:hypothetical protein
MLSSLVKNEHKKLTCSGVSSPISSERFAINIPHSVLVPTPVTFFSTKGIYEYQEDINYTQSLMCNNVMTRESLDIKDAHSQKTKEEQRKQKTTPK